MKLNKKEKEICKKFRNHPGKIVNCCNCPLVIDQDAMLCKANITKECYEEYYQNLSLEERDNLKIKPKSVYNFTCGTYH